MSRSGYTDDYDDHWALIRWRGAVASATKGARGQQLLRDMLAALDAMPVKELVAGELETSTGKVCALGALGKRRGLSMEHLDPENHRGIADAFGIAHALACEIMFQNDDGWYGASSESRWIRMRNWIAEQIKEGRNEKG